MNITVWVDADSCPKLVKNYLVSYCAKLNQKIIFVANKNIPVENPGPDFSMVVCPEESQAADNYILQNAKIFDLAVTRDIPLAAELIKKGVVTLNDRGLRFSRDNIDRKLAERKLNMEMSNLGLSTSAKSTYSKKEFSEFANCFDREIHLLLNFKGK